MSSMTPCSSSAGRRAVCASDGNGSSTRTDRACSPRRPSATPNSTRWPGLSVVPDGSADAWTYTSPPSSRDKKPKPLSVSNHLTLPLGTACSSLETGFQAIRLESPALLGILCDDGPTAIGRACSDRGHDFQRGRNVGSVDPAGPDAAAPRDQGDRPH